MSAEPSPDGPGELRNLLARACGGEKAPAALRAQVTDEIRSAAAELRQRPKAGGAPDPETGSRPGLAEGSLASELRLAVHGRPGSPGTRARLRESLREAVRAGRLAPGSQLPSSRALAADLGLARNTVADAYAELVVEGWLCTKQGASTRVARRSRPRAAAGTPPVSAHRAEARHDLRPGRPDVSSFPRAQWVRAVRHALAVAPDEAFGDRDPCGRTELRAALANHLARSRGVLATPAQIMICAGTAHALTLIGTALRARDVHAVAVESYGRPGHRAALARTGLRTPAVGVDEHGARTDELDGMPAVGAVLVTAAHQFPTGAALRPDRRSAVIDWARASGSFVVDNDYDGEFRYDRRPVGALQGLGPEHTIHLGTAGTSLAPGLRLSWLVAPESLLADLNRAAGQLGHRPGVVTQLALARFIESGAYDRHLRTRRRAYRRRREQLAEALAAAAPHAKVTGPAAGLHTVVELPAGGETTALQAASHQSLALHGIAGFRHPSAPARADALVVGYAAPRGAAWNGALDALCRVLS